MRFSMLILAAAFTAILASTQSTRDTDSGGAGAKQINSPASTSSSQPIGGSGRNGNGDFASAGNAKGVGTTARTFNQPTSTTSPSSISRSDGNRHADAADAANRDVSGASATAREFNNSVSTFL